VGSLEGSNTDAVTRTNLPASRHDRHHARLERDLTVWTSTKRRRHEACLKPIKLNARIAQPGDLDLRITPQGESGSGRESEKVHTRCREIFSEHARRNAKAGGHKTVQTLGCDQVNLTQIGLRGIYRHPAAMFHRGAGVRVPLNAVTLDESNEQRRRLGEGVPAGAGDRNDPWCGAVFGCHSITLNLRESNTLSA